MSKQIKDMIVAEYKRRFNDVSDALVIDIRGIEANENNNLRIDLAEIVKAEAQALQYARAEVVYDDG